MGVDEDAEEAVDDLLNGTLSLVKSNDRNY
jgi:hypothetical protein